MDSIDIFGLVCSILSIDTGVSAYMYIVFVQNGWKEKYYFCPHIIYNHTKLNWFGCALISILLILLSHLYVLLAFVYWIFHVGRNNET